MADRAYHRAWRARHPEKGAAAVRRYRQSHPGIARRDYSLYKKRHPDRIRAQKLVYKAVKRGQLIKPSTCSRCGTEGRIEGHHADYAQPLVVIWLCKLCHLLEDKHKVRKD